MPVDGMKHSQQGDCVQRGVGDGDKSRQAFSKVGGEDGDGDRTWTSAIC